jgi:hypothetical protein
MSWRDWGFSDVLGTSVATLCQYMKTQNCRADKNQFSLFRLQGAFQILALAVLILSSLSCALPPSTLYGSSSTTGSTSYASDSSNQSNTSNTTGTTSSAASAPTSTSSPTPISTAAASSCTFATPQLKSSGSYYYVYDTVSVSSSIQIVSVSFSVTDATSQYTEYLGTTNTIPYTVGYWIANGYATTSTLTATVVDASGNTSTCNTAYQISW